MLGPLEVRTDDDSGIVLDVGGSRLRALLIMLALRPGQLVPARQLIDGLWADQPPAGAANALQALVSRLRRALPGAVIESRPAGYQLKLGPRSTDIVRFEELAAKGRTQLRDDPAAAAATLREALALWRGPALVDVADSDFGQAVIARLDELRLLATENRIDADLRTGVTVTLVAELEGLVVAHPMREPLAARLMRALHACGRRGAALQVYEQTKERLVEQLGIELLGASLAVRGTTDRSVIDEERVAADARAVLGKERYDSAYQGGQRVTLDTLTTLVALTPGA